MLAKAAIPKNEMMNSRARMGWPDTNANASPYLGSGAPLPPMLIDHCFADWDGHAEIEDELGRIVITANNAPHLHIYAPPMAPDLCVEPVTHLPDAVNRPEWAMPALPPGETATVQMRIEES